MLDKVKDLRPDGDGQPETDRPEIVSLPQHHNKAQTSSAPALVHENAVVTEYGAQTVREPEGSEQSRALWQYVSRFGLILVQAILMVAVLAGSYFVTDRMLAQKPEPRKRPAFKTVYTVETVTAEAKDRQPTILAYGQTIAARSVDLRALVPGEIIRVNPALRVGGRVETGAALVEIDAFDYRGALQEAEANLAEARARIVENDAQVALEESRLAAAREQLALASADFDRAQQLRTRGTGTQKAVDDRRLIVSQREQAISLAQDTIKVQQSRRQQIAASIQRLEWRVEQAKRNLNSTTLTAPFDGIVRATTAEVGRNITANDVVVSLDQADTLEVRFTLTDAQYGRLQRSGEELIGRSLEVVWTVGGQQSAYEAVIDRLGAEITSSRGGVELFARITRPATDNAITIRPGAFVEINVPDRLYRNTVLVPDTAIYGTDTAYVAVDGRLQERKVTVVGFEGEQALVAEGLQAGDEVLTTRITEVSEGLLVRREGEAEPARETGGGAGQPMASRPSQEEVQAIVKANGLTMEQWRALDRSARRDLISKHRTQTGA
ncbi:MAG: efflux RND transporter periplasmic adaptor subunit [Pseudomonadota bacterium]